MVNNSYTQSVESHEAEHCPVEGVRLHHAANRNAQETLLAAKICGWTSFCTSDASSGHGHTFLMEGERDAERNCSPPAVSQHVSILTVGHTSVTLTGVTTAFPAAAEPVEPCCWEHFMCSYFL